MREEERNRLLRRIDWRFLLAQPRPAATLCFSEDLVDPLELVSRVSRSAPSEDSETGFDLAVALDPEPKTLETAWKALGARGALYTEWRLRRSGGWREITSRLSRAGFEDVACFWALPDPAKTPATVWIPLEAPEPLDYFRTRRKRSRNPVRLAGRAVRRVQWKFRPRRPVCAIGRKLPALGSPSGISQSDSLIEEIRDNWSTWGLGPCPRRIVRLMRASPGRSSGKVVAFLFAEGDAAPRLVVKMARTPEAAAGLRREAEVLRFLETHRGGVDGTPRVLLSRAEGVVVETALPGLPLPAFLGRRRYRELATAASAWLVGLAGPDDGARISWGGFVDRELREFESRFGSVLDPGLLRAIERPLAELPVLRSVCEQRDFSPWNVLRTPEGRLSVLDWESSESHGLPALDLIYFLAYLALYLDGALRNGRQRESFRRSLESDSLTGSVARDCLEDYADRTNTPREAVRPLRLLAWLLHSRSEYHQLAEDGGGRPDPDRLRQSFFLDLLREELR